MINLEEVARFVRANPGEGLLLESDKRRVVRLELNTEAPCQLKVQLDAKDVRFLANVEGRETVTFIADGPVAIWPDCEGEVWWFTPEMETQAVEIPDAVSFTKIVDPFQRNPEIERLAALAAVNQNRMMAYFEGIVGDLRKDNQALAEEVKNARTKPAGADTQPASSQSGGDAGTPGTGQPQEKKGNGDGGAS